MRIAFDVDGVLRDLMGAYVPEVRKTVAELTDYGKAVEFAGGVDQLLELLDHRACWLRAGTHAHMVGLHKQIEASGHTIVIVTAIATAEGRKQTLQWLDANEIVYDELHFCADKVRVDFDAIIEDHPVNAQLAAQAGRAAFLVHRPWTANTQLYHANLFRLPRDEEALEVVWEVLNSRAD